jgi:hypothetical protein
MGACLYCKWWGMFNKGVCDFVNTIHANYPPTHFMVEVSPRWDDTNIEYEVKTGPYFGCIHFNKKGDQQ